MDAQFYGKGINVQLGSDVEVMRGPWAGRIFEAFGEDPYLSVIAGAETVTGIQSQNVVSVLYNFICSQLPNIFFCIYEIACVKHYILYSQNLNSSGVSSLVMLLFSDSHIPFV